MLKYILKNKKGVTLLEAVIALGLLSLVAAAAFGVLLATSRKESRPNFQEEMAWAVERAHAQLQMYDGGNVGALPEASRGLCGNDDAPLGTGEHTITCMLPAICDWSNSSFKYTVGTTTFSNVQSALPAEQQEAVTPGATGITFSITCNGFTGNSTNQENN